MVAGLLVAVASLVGDTGSRPAGSVAVACELKSADSVVMEYRLRRPAACGSVPEQ